MTYRVCPGIFPYLISKQYPESVEKKKIKLDHKDKYFSYLRTIADLKHCLIINLVYFLIDRSDF